MKRDFMLILVVSALLILTACGGVPQVATAPGAAQTPGVPRDLPLAMQLALGTFKLEGTDYPVSAEQATSLLPLWKAARSLSQSETAAAEEIQALVKQIQQTMTPEQLQAIEAMSLSFQDVASLSQELGLEIGGGRFGGDVDPSVQATRQAARQSGQAPPGGFGGGPGGGFPGGGGGPGGPGGDLSPEARQTAIAERGGFQRAGLGVPQQLLDALIEFLQAKVQ